jgi:hypothetical protein
VAVISPWGRETWHRRDTTRLNNSIRAKSTRLRSYRVVTTPQILDNLSYVTGAHIVKPDSTSAFIAHNDQRGQPGGINVTPVLTVQSERASTFGHVRHPDYGSQRPEPCAGNH